VVDPRLRHDLHPAVVDGVAHVGDWTGNAYAADAAIGDHGMVLWGPAERSPAGAGGLAASTPEGT